MKKDLEVFKDIRLKANSGLYKYRTKKQIDSLYIWAENEIDKASIYRDFYNIICKLTDFEGSLHNSTSLPSKFRKSLREESYGYFPYPIKWIEGKWRINFDKGNIPLGAEIISINNEKIYDIITNLYKYYTTDGVNTTGKRIGIDISFSKYYRFNYGLKDEFIIEYKTIHSNEIKKTSLSSVAYKDFYKNVNKRYSKPFDYVNHKDWKENETYTYEMANKHTGILTVNDFGLGNEENPKHLKYVSFLDSVFTSLKHHNIKNLIVDVRYNGGGDDPNDLVTYSYLTQRNFQENKRAWISFEKIPLLRYIDFWLPKFLRPLFVGSYNKDFKEEFPLEKNGKFCQDENSADHFVRIPNKNAFTGNIYLLISPRVASAGSLFAAMVNGNKNTTSIGEETMGGYYGHNGHTPLAYKLPKSKIVVYFSVVNLEQDVPKKSNQYYNRGIIPDIEVSQSLADFLIHEDTQLNYVLKLIENKDK
ncbi:S41 family peptidase [Winogradskyella pelagia]|nr:S41 family peptidase [Winogradskyella sp. DF17]